MAAYSIVRIKKLKSWGAVAGAVSHNARRRETLNADPKALPRNKFLIGSSYDDPVEICKARLGDQRIRKNAVYGIDGFLGASPEYFRPDAPEQYGVADQERLDAWVKASVNWLKERYGDRVINAVLHLDEATPHIQFLLLPLDDSGKLNCRALFGGKKYVLSQLQSDYAQAVAHLGLIRGREGSKASHMEVAEYYVATQKVERTPLPELPTLEDIQPPEPPNIASRMKAENLIAYAKETGVKAAADQMAQLAPVLESLTKQNDFLIAENARLKQEREQLKDSNSHLNRENSDFKVIAKDMRELDLSKVLVQMFGAEEAPNSSPKRRDRIFILPDGVSINYTGNQWRVGENGFKGKGSVNLVMHLSGYGQDQYQQTVREMAEVFMDKDAVTSTLAAHLVSTASREVQKIAEQKFEMPKPYERTWPGVCGFLQFQMKMPEPFVNELHERGLIFSDPRGNCVFARDNDSGVFKVGTTEKPFNQTLGKGGGPFVMPGTDGNVFVIDSPLEALSLKLMHPDSAVLATGGFMQPGRLEPYLAGKEIFLAPSRDKKGQEMARHLAAHFKKATRIQPDHGDSWNEHRLRQIKERKEMKTQSPQKVQAETRTATPTISRSTGMSR